MKSRSAGTVSNGPELSYYLPELAVKISGIMSGKLFTCQRLLQGHLAC